MRSRDGNLDLSLRLCRVAIIFSSLALNASDYFISYKYIVKDAALYNETLLISKAMTKCQGAPQEEFVLQSQGEESLKKLIYKNSEKFIEYIHRLGLHVRHDEKTVDMQNSYTTVLTLKPTCFKVDFNDNFAIIAPLK